MPRLKCVGGGGAATFSVGDKSFCLNAGQEVEVDLETVEKFLSPTYGAPGIRERVKVLGVDLKKKREEPQVEPPSTTIDTPTTIDEEKPTITLEEAGKDEEKTEDKKFERPQISDGTVEEIEEKNTEPKKNTTAMDRRRGRTGKKRKDGGK